MKVVLFLKKKEKKDEGGLCGGNREPAGLCAIGGFSSQKPSVGGLWWLAREWVVRSTTPMSQTSNSSWDLLGLLFKDLLELCGANFWETWWPFVMALALSTHAACLFVLLPFFNRETMSSEGVFSLTYFCSVL